MDMVLIAGLWLRATVWDKTASKLTRLGHNPQALRMPGIDDGSASAASGPDIGLDKQLDAVIAAIEACDRPLIVGHSAAAKLAWMAADRRPDQVAGVAMVGGFPQADGSSYLDGITTQGDGRAPFPGWSAFDEAEIADLDEQAQAKIEQGAVPVSRAVAQAKVTLQNPARSEVPLAIVCTDFEPEDVQTWLMAGQLPELGNTRDVTLIDVETGHWPMVSAPGELAAALDRFAADLSR